METRQTDVGLEGVASEDLRSRFGQLLTTLDSLLSEVTPTVRRIAASREELEMIREELSRRNELEEHHAERPTASPAVCES